MISIFVISIGFIFLLFPVLPLILITSSIIKQHGEINLYIILNGTIDMSIDDGHEDLRNYPIIWFYVFSILFMLIGLTLIYLGN